MGGFGASFRQDVERGLVEHWRFVADSSWGVEFPIRITSGKKLALYPPFGV